MKRSLVIVAGATLFALTGAATASAIPTGSGAGINSGGAAGSSEPPTKTLELPIETERPIFVAPYGPAESANPQYTFVASTQEQNAALDNFTTVVGAAGAAGTVAGGVAGFVIGCPIGAALGLPLAILPGALGGCLVGGVAGAGIGAGLGSLAGGGAAGLAAGVDVVQTHFAAPGTTHWAQ